MWSLRYTPVSCQFFLAQFHLPSPNTALDVQCDFYCSLAHTSPENERLSTQCLRHFKRVPDKFLLSRIQKESIVKKIRTRDFDESPRFRPPRVRKTQFWNYVCVSVFEHDDSKTIKATGMKFGM
ncbi:hypothetical protein AVEN_106368-1 [Araneus ventricosus]|uniref:Uncharacterized protein n=1 Tax=Araneus ventricosus TaxID=182803 RepID=A0A4Y2ATL4_ARAVE|nr:hypothetical protein AVEN_106368-1 [Araneus ventricosus]